MIIILISVIGLAIIGAIALIQHIKYRETDPLVTWCALVFGIATVICSSVVIGVQVRKPAKIAELSERRAALVYQLENGYYLGDSLGEFNAELKKSHFYATNPWTSWMNVDYTKYVDPIDVKEEKQ